MRTLLLALMCFSGWISAQERLFDAAEPLRIEIRTDLAALLGNRTDTADYQFAQIFFKLGDTRMMQPAEIKPGGNFRLREANCELPPLRLRLPETGLQPLFEGQHKIKLVLPCQGEPLVMREYLVYRLYNALTPHSLRVRPVRVLLADVSGSELAISKLGFLVEDPDAMAARCGGELLKHPLMHPDSCSREAATRVHLFEYMIGNTDWDVRSGKNLKWLVLPGDPRPVPIPYDFDWSKAVDAPYTGLDAAFERRSLRGLCRAPEEYDAALADFRQARPALMEVLNTSLLPKRDQREMTAYLGEFFAMIDTPAWVQAVLYESCAAAAR
ncbi:MAG: hypothetical protein NW241_01825 [Bacteroidia bacterium]|nr:hypothetical protein [Bacteroidia bacterium]